jgi:uncharacterized protein YukE
MSTPLRADPAALRSVAAQLHTRASDTAELQQRAKHGWSRLDSGWRSYAKDDADAQFDTAKRQLDRAVALFMQLAQALEASASLIERADADAAAHYARENDTGQPTDKAPAPPWAMPAPFFPIPSPDRGAPKRPLDPYPPPPGVTGPPSPSGPPSPPGPQPNPNQGTPPTTPPGPAKPPKPVPPWMQTIDTVITDALNGWLPDIAGSEEYTRIKLSGDVKFQDLGIPVALAPGATLKITRRSDGTYEIRLEGTGDVLAGFDLFGFEAQAGMRGKSDTRLVFDPSKPGDMSAMALFLIGSGAQVGAGLLPSAVITNLLTARLTDEHRLLWVDNVRSSVTSAGLVLKGKFPGPVEARLNSDYLVGAGFERMPDGRVANVTVLSSKSEARLKVPNLVATAGAQGKLESDTRITIADSQPPVTRIEVKLKASAGALISLNVPGTDNAATLVNSGSGEVTYTVTVKGDSQAVLDQLAAGTLDVDALRQQGVDIGATLVANGSLNNSAEASIDIPTVGKITGEIERGVTGPDTPITVPGLTF